MDDEVMARVIAAVQRGRAGERTAAREELEAMWAEVERGGGDDAYGELVRGALDTVGRALAEGSTERLPGH